MSLNIRPEQLQAFQPVADAAFVRRLADHIRAGYADAVVRIPSGPVPIGQVPERTLKRMIEAGMSKARGYGMTWESTMAAFVVLTFLSAPNFDKHPLIERVLRDPGVKPENRMDNLWTRLSPQNWKAVETYYDVNAWSLDESQPEGSS